MWFDDTPISLPHQDESRLLRRWQSSTPSRFFTTGSISDQHAPLSESNLHAVQPKKVFATIWRSQPEKSPHVRQRAGTCQDHVDLSHRLTTDPQLEDWHVVCLADTANSDTSAKPQSSDKLCKRFAASICHGRAWYLRCGQLELSDMVAWLIWQEYEPISVLRQPPWTFIDDSDGHAGLSDTEISSCRHSLLILFDTRSAEEIRIALLMVYFVSNSFRRLSLSELVEAVRCSTLSESDCRGRLEHDASPCLPHDHLLNICSPLLENDADGNIVFLEPSMKRFISTVQLPGLEHGHGTMTQMCFAQIRQLGATFIVRPWKRFREWFRSCRDWPLFRYVASYWWCHYRLAAASRKDLSAELIRIVNIAFAGQSLGQTPILLQRRMLNAGYGVAQVYGLPELKTILQNMGASEILSHMPIPSSQQWQHMRPVFRINIPDQVSFNYTPTVSEVLDARSILCIREDAAAAITAELSALHIQLGQSFHISCTDQDEAFPPLLEYGQAQFDDWEKIDIEELEQQALLKFEDWEYVCTEGTQDFV